MYPRADMLLKNEVYLDRSSTHAASQLVVHVGIYIHEEDVWGSFFGFCFGVIECATAQHFLSRDPSGPPLTENAGRGGWYVTQNCKAEKM